jgi:hypothetical protein
MDCREMQAFYPSEALIHLASWNGQTRAKSLFFSVLHQAEEIYFLWI